MSDLIVRLRNPMWAHGNIPFESPQLEQEENLAAMNEAAAEIERLREALRYIIAEGDHVSRWVLADKARTALAVPSDQCGGEHG